MSKWSKVGLWVLAGMVLIGSVFVTGRKFFAGNESANISQTVPKKEDEKGLILKGQVVKYDTVSLTVALEGDGEKNFSDLVRVSVWEIKDGRPQKADWLKVTEGQKVSLSMDKSGQKLISVIVYE